MTPDDLEKVKRTIKAEMFSRFGVAALILCLIYPFYGFIADSLQMWGAASDQKVKVELEKRNSELESQKAVQVEKIQADLAIQKGKQDIERLQIESAIREKERKESAELEEKNKAEIERVKQVAEARFIAQLETARKRVGNAESELAFLELKQKQAKLRIIDYERSSMPDDKIELERDKVLLASLSEKVDAQKKYIASARIAMQKIEADSTKY